MKPEAKAGAQGMTLIELLVVLAIIGVFFAMMLPARIGPRKSKVIVCLNNLHRLGVHLGDFCNASDDYPARVSITNGGALELTGSNSPAAAYFCSLQRYATPPSFLVCPFDKAKTAARRFDSLSNSNVSYFLSLDATPALPRSLLAGDHHLLLHGQPVRPGLLPLSTNATLGWTPGVHHSFLGGPAGNLLFADLHVEGVVSTNLNTRVREQGLGTNRLVLP